MNGKNKRLNLIYIIIQSFYWMSGCAVMSFAAVFLSDIGLSESVIGTICAFGSVGGFVLMTLGSLYIDSSPRALFRLIRTIQGAVFLLCIVLSLIHQPLIVCAAAYSLSIALVQTLPPVYNTLYMSIRNSGEYADYGVARGLGSLMFSCSSAAVGLMVAKLGSHILPIIVPVLLIPQIFGAEHIGRSLQCRSAAANSRERFDMKGLAQFVKQHPAFRYFCVGVGIMSAVNRVFSTFLNLICERCGGDTSTMGMLLAYMALLEVPVIVCFTKLQEKFSIKKLVTVSFLCYTLKAALMTYAGSIPALVAASTLHALSFGLLTPASIVYVSEIISPEEAGKGQNLLAAAPVLLTGIVVMASGFLFDALGVHTGLIMMTGLSAIGCVTGLKALRIKDK